MDKFDRDKVLEASVSYFRDAFRESFEKFTRITTGVSHDGKEEILDEALEEIGLCRIHKLPKISCTKEEPVMESGQAKELDESAAGSPCSKNAHKGRLTTSCLLVSPLSLVSLSLSVFAFAFSIAGLIAMFVGS